MCSSDLGHGQYGAQARSPYRRSPHLPAVDVEASGTRREEILLAADELKVVWKLRRVLHALDNMQAIELLLNKLKETKTNFEFLLQVQKTTPDQPMAADEKEYS